MTDNQSCRECRHANIDKDTGHTYCHWQQTIEIVAPWWATRRVFVFPTDGTECPAFERRQPSEE